MKQLLLATLISIGLTLGANAQRYIEDDVSHTMSSKKINKMDRKYTRHKAKKRHFKNEKEFLHRSKHFCNKTYHKHSKYMKGYNYKRKRYKVGHYKKRQQGFNRWKRGWKLAYRYDRASFYDDHGYYYGYFNRYGYFFEDVFYTYDRYYTYQDRVRGKGLFDHRYYMPANSRHYGFYS